MDAAQIENQLAVHEHPDVVVAADGEDHVVAVDRTVIGYGELVLHGEAEVVVQLVLLAEEGGAVIGDTHRLIGIAVIVGVAEAVKREEARRSVAPDVIGVGRGHRVAVLVLLRVGIDAAQTQALVILDNGAAFQLGMVPVAVVGIAAVLTVVDKLEVHRRIDRLSAVNDGNVVLPFVVTFRPLVGQREQVVKVESKVEVGRGVANHIAVAVQQLAQRVGHNALTAVGIELVNVRIAGVVRGVVDKAELTRSVHKVIGIPVVSETPLVDPVDMIEQRIAHLIVKEVGFQGADLLGVGQLAAVCQGGKVQTGLYLAGLDRNVGTPDSVRQSLTVVAPVRNKGADIGIGARRPLAELTSGTPLSEQVFHLDDAAIHDLHLDPEAHLIDITGRDVNGLIRFQLNSKGLIVVQRAHAPAADKRREGGIVGTAIAVVSSIPITTSR